MKNILIFKKQSHLLWCFVFMFAINIQGSLGQQSFTGTGANNTYSQTFDNAGTATTYAGSLATLPANWTSSSTTYGGFYSRGNTYSATNGNFALRNLTAGTEIAMGAKPAAGTATNIIFTGVNNTGAAITGFTINYNVEQYSAAATATTVNFAYNINGGSYVTTGITGTTLVTASTLATAANLSSITSTSRSITISEISIPNTQNFSFRFAIGGASGAQAHMGIDDFSVYVTPSNAAPTASSVAITGTSNVGQMLTGNYTYADTESNPQGTSTFKWYRADDNSGTNEAAIVGATSSTYTLVASDLGKYIRFGVVPIATAGTLTGIETFSSRVGPVGAGSSPVVTITGTLNEATINTATVGVTLANETFADATLSSANFTLTNAPTGVTVASVEYNGATTATITLAYNDTDFDVNLTNFNLTIAGSELTLGTPLTSNNLTITAVTESLTLGAITSFGNQCLNVLSAEQQFTISGSNLKAGNISLAAINGFTYSETASGTYTSTLSFANTAGTLTNKIIYVKFLPTVVQSYNGDIAVSNSGAPTVNRSVVGSGVNTAPTVTTPTNAAITSSSATLGGNITAIGCSNVTSRGVEYSTTSSFTNGTGTVVSESAVSYPTGTFTVSVTGLTGGTLYYYKAFATSAAGTAYSAQNSFTTLLAEPANHPTNFAAGTVSTTAISQTWAASVAGAQAPSGYLIKASTTTVIDPEDGVDPSNVTAFSGGTANRKVTGASTTTGASFTGMSSGTMYNYKIYPYTGTGSGINFKIAAAPGFSHATLPTAPTALSNANLQANSAAVSWTLGTHNAGNKILVFAKAGSAITTGTPTNAPSTYTANTIFGSGTAFQNDAAAFCVYKGDGSSANLTGLNPNTTYHIAMYRVVEMSNSNGTNSYSAVLIGTVTTLTAPVTLPYAQDFEGVTNEWVLESTGTGTNKWAIGSATNNGGTKALYISNDNGASNTYTTSGQSQSGTNASVRVDLTGLSNATLSFDWKSNGEISSGTIYDYGEVYINSGASDILISGVKEFYNTTTFALKTIDLTPYVGQIVTLKFRWVNDGSSGAQPPFAVDNVNIVPFGLPSLTTVAITGLTYNTATSGGTIASDGGTAITARGIVYSIASSPTLSSTVVNSGSGTGTFTSNLTGLLSNTTYYVRAFATNANGTTYGNQVIFITPSINTPQASNASNISSNSFTANWSPVAGATSYEVDVYEVSPGDNATDLFISEYIEGTSNNKYIEIFNGTGNTVSLSDYQIRLFNNGATTVTNTESLTGTLANGAVLVFRNTGATIVGTTNFNTSSTVNYNGDDALGLYKISTASYVDIFGVIGSDPGTSWTGTGGQNTVDETLRRKSSVLSGVTVNPTGTGASAFTTLSTQWDYYDIDNVSGLGSHVFDGGTVTTYSLQNQNVGNNTSYNVTGLNPEKEYFYVVRASDGQISANSNVISVTTTQITWNGNEWSNTLGPDTAKNAVIAGNYDDAQAITAKNLTINADAQLIVRPTQVLSITGNLTNNGTIVFKSDATGTGSFGQYTGAPIAGTGLSTVERYIPGRRAWRLLAAPLTGTANNSISANWQSSIAQEGLLLFSPASLAYTGYVTGGTSPNIRKYTNGAFQNVTNLTTEPMFGIDATDTNAFLVFATGPSTSDNIATGAAATTLRPKGKLITGSVTQSLNANQFKLIANPYASPINPALLIASNVGAKMWLINPSVGVGAYVTFDGNWSIEPANAIDGYIQSGQGFFARTPTAGTFSINENHKVVGNSNNWFEKNANSVEETESVDKIRVLLYKQEASNWTITDGILAVNQASGNNEVDGKDASKISNFNESLMFRNNTSNLSIEYRALPQLGDLQPLRMTGTTAIPYQLRIFAQNYINSTLQPYLEDTSTGTFTAIPTSGSEVVIPFTGAVSTSTNPDNRFRIVYQTNLSNAETDALLASVFPNPVTNNQLNINLGSNAGVANYTITNLLGQVVQNGSLNNTQNVITIATANQGFYILNITQDGKSFTTKIYVQ